MEMVRTLLVSMKEEGLATDQNLLAVSRYVCLRVANNKAITFVLVTGDDLPVEAVSGPEPSVKEQELMQNEARAIVNVYVRVRKYKSTQALELVQNIYDEVLQAGEDIVHSVPFDVNIYEFVKELNQRHCLAPRVGVFQSGSVSPNFTSHAQKVYRNGGAVQLVIGIPTELSTQDEAALADLQCKADKAIDKVFGGE